VTDLLSPQLGEPHHIAYVVDDIEATVERLLAQLGAGPFFVMENVPLEDVTSAGEPATFAHNSAFGRWGEGTIELIQPASLAPERVEQAFAPPRPRVQHVAYVAAPDAVDGVRHTLGERGLSPYLSTWLGGAETTLHDASTILGHDIEIHGDNEGLRGFFGMVSAAAEDWDGSEPLRAVEL
jgi:hypothetical protein